MSTKAAQGSYSLPLWFTFRETWHVNGYHTFTPVSSWSCWQYTLTLILGVRKERVTWKLQAQLLILFEKFFIILLPTVCKGQRFNSPLLLASLMKLNLLVTSNLKKQTLKFVLWRIRLGYFHFFCFKLTPRTLHKENYQLTRSLTDMCHVAGSQLPSSPLWACVKRSRLVSGPPSPSTKGRRSLYLQHYF